MIIDRYLPPANMLPLKPSDPILQELDWILEDPELFRLVRGDLARHYKRSKYGRPPEPVEVTLRLIVLRRRKQWSYRQIEHVCLRPSAGRKCAIVPAIEAGCESTISACRIIAR
jgi:hypothetical protein